MLPNACEHRLLKSVAYQIAIEAHHSGADNLPFIYGGDGRSVRVDDVKQEYYTRATEHAKSNVLYLRDFFKGNFSNPPLTPIVNSSAGPTAGPPPQPLATLKRRVPRRT